MTYPKVTEIKRTEWEPEQITPTTCDRCGKPASLTSDPEGSGCEWCAWCADYIAHERATRLRSIPTVCPKR